jgi:hypothetical protein
LPVIATLTQQFTPPMTDLFSNRSCGTSSACCNLASSTFLGGDTVRYSATLSTQCVDNCLVREYLSETLTLTQLFLVLAGSVTHHQELSQTFDDLRPILGSSVLEYVTVDALTRLPVLQCQFGIDGHRRALPNGINQLLYVQGQRIIEGDHAHAAISRSREDWLLSSVTGKFYPSAIKVFDGINSISVKGFGIPVVHEEFRDLPKIDYVQRFALQSWAFKGTFACQS